jgi:hypothetical protein
MTKKTNTNATLDKAEILLRDLEAASRGRRLAKAEKDVKDAAKPKTLAGRAVALKRAEGEIAARERKDARLVFTDMKPVKSKPAKPLVKAALARAYRDAIAARR